jgi:hypothetical protein
MKKFKVLFAFIGLFLFGVTIASQVVKHTNVNPAAVILTSVAFVTLVAFAEASVRYKGGVASAISYTSPTTITGEVYEEVMNEVLFVNNTIKKKLVRFIDNVKANIPIKTLAVTVADQAYSSGAPTSSGTLTPGDKLITPVKRMFYQEFDYETLRGTAWGQDMKPGAFEIVSDEFTRAALELVAPKQSLFAESRFWNGATSATKTAVAALTAGTAQNAVGAAEQTYVAAATSSFIDGVITKLIYNTAAVGTRVKVAGTTLSSSNIKTESDKAYAAIPAKMLQPENMEGMVMYMPYSCIGLINVYNNTPTNFKDAFIPVGKNEFTFNSIKIEFVPIPDNCIVIAKAMDIVWTTDLTDDTNNIKVDKIATNREDYFMKSIYSIESWIFNQADKVLYLG